MNFKKGLGEEAFEKLAALRNDSAKVAQEGGYNGYTNYETWAVCLWLDNDSGNYEYWQERVQELTGELGEGFEESKYWSPDEKVKFTIADELKGQFEDLAEQANLEGVLADLLNGALSEVKWDEVAENVLAK